VLWGIQYSIHTKFPIHRCLEAVPVRRHDGRSEDKANMCRRNLSYLPPLTSTKLFPRNAGLFPVGLTALTAGAPRYILLSSLAIDPPPSMRARTLSVLATASSLPPGAMVVSARPPNVKRRMPQPLSDDSTSLLNRTVDELYSKYNLAFTRCSEYHISMHSSSFRCRKHSTHNDELCYPHR